MPRYDNDADSMWILLRVLMWLLFIGLMVFRGIWVKEAVAIKSLRTLGFTEVTITNHAWFLVGLRGCDAADAARFTAIAKNPIGEKVPVTVCSGWLFKGATIRTPTW